MAAPIESGGTLIYEHNACNIYNGTGANATCTQWDTTIEIPAVHFFYNSLWGTFIWVFMIGFAWYIFAWVQWKIATWLFHLFTTSRDAKLKE